MSDELKKEDIKDEREDFLYKENKDKYEFVKKWITQDEDINWRPGGFTFKYTMPNDFGTRTGFSSNPDQKDFLVKSETFIVKEDPIEIVKDEIEKPYLTAKDIYLLNHTPHLYFKYRDKPEYSSEEIESDLMYHILFKPDTIEEKFNIIENQPYSESMSIYLNTLAGYILDTLKEKEEISEEEIMNLKQKAYKNTYSNEPFETLDIIAKERYDGYFRGLLDSKDKYLVTQSKFNRFKEISKDLAKNVDIAFLLRSYVGYRKEIRNTEFIENKVNLLSTPDAVYPANIENVGLYGGDIYYYEIRKVERISKDFINNIESTSIPTEVAHTYICIENQLKNNKYKSDIKLRYIMFDSDGYSQNLSFKDSTIQKWKTEYLDNLKKIIEEHNFDNFTIRDVEI